MSSQEIKADIRAPHTQRSIGLAQILASDNNPRMLFDTLPLQELEESIRVHSVLVPIIVYFDDAIDRYRIIDGERRYRCCKLLNESGIPGFGDIPTNVVDPPDPLSRILYMFVIHKHRLDWELMPTALSLQDVMNELGEQGADTKRLKQLTGLGEMQIERCRILLSFPRIFQDMSLQEDPGNRIPANFWIEAYPLLNDLDANMPSLVSAIGGRDGVTQRLVDKYWARSIRSVIHFRRVMDALTLPLTREGAIEQEQGLSDARQTLTRWLDNVHLETRTAFDPLFRDDRRVVRALELCTNFRTRLDSLKIDNTLDRSELRKELQAVADAVSRLLDLLNTGEGPDLFSVEQDEDD